MDIAGVNAGSGLLNIFVTFALRSRRAIRVPEGTAVGLRRLKPNRAAAIFGATAPRMQGKQEG
jgi:hypothetical protein